MASYHGFFTSKRGTNWSYNISEDGWIEQWHPNTVRCTGGWKTGRDTYSPVPTKECFDAIERLFGFKKDPNCDWAVIVPDYSLDTPIATYRQSIFDGYAAAFNADDGKIRLIRWDRPDKQTVNLIRMFDSLDDAETLLNRWSSFDSRWTKEE